MEHRRILLDGNIVEVLRDRDALVAADGRRVEAASATHLARARVRHLSATGSHLVPEAHLGIERSRRGRGATGELSLPEL